MNQKTIYLIIRIEQRITITIFKSKKNKLLLPSCRIGQQLSLINHRNNNLILTLTIVVLTRPLNHLFPPMDKEVQIFRLMDQIGNLLNHALKEIIIILKSWIVNVIAQRLVMIWSEIRRNILWTFSNKVNLA